MFFSLLAVTLLISVAVAYFTVRLFDRPIAAILRRIVAEELGSAWHRYIKFAAYVVGVSGGVRVYELERYVTGTPLPRSEFESPPLVLTPERWTLEVYRTILSTVQSIAWMLLIVFVVALVAFVVVRGFELRAGGRRDHA